MMLVKKATKSRQTRDKAGTKPTLMSESSNPVQSYDDFAPTSKKKTIFRILTKNGFLHGKRLIWLMVNLAGFAPR